MRTINCKHCGRLSQRKSKASKYCSTLCRVRAARLRRVSSGGKAYSCLKERCSNPNHKSFKFYGGKGVTLEISSHDFQKFYSSINSCEICKCEVKIGDHKSRFGKCVDRIDSSAGYDRSNIRILCRGCNTRQSVKKQTRGYHGRFC